MTVNDIITIRNLVILALTLLIVYLTNALRVQRHRLQFTEELYPDDFATTETAALHRLQHHKRVDLLFQD